MTKSSLVQFTEPTVIERTLRYATASYREGRVREAEELCRAILQVQPANPDANYNLGVLRVQARQPEAGLPYFIAAIEANPAASQYWLSYIEALLLAGHRDDARQVLEHARQQGLQGEKAEALAAQLTVEPDERRVSDGVPQSLVKASHRKSGKKFKKKAIAQRNVDPSRNEVDALVNSFNRGNYSQGEALARSMTARYPAHVFGWKVLGAILKSLGRSAEAMDCMQQAVTLAPQDAEAQNNLGVVFSDLNRVAEAEMHHRQAVAIDPKFPQAYFNLANALQTQGKTVEAEASYRLTLRLKPDFADAHFNLGNILRSQGRNADAAISYEQALQYKPGYAEAHNNLGVTLKELNSLPEAEKHYRLAIGLKPGFCEAHNNLGNVLKDQNRYSEAENSYRVALEIKPDFVAAHSNLGDCLKNLSRYAEAETSCRRALALDPNYVDAHNNLGVALKYLKRFAEEEACYRQALALDPNHVDAHNNLGIALKHLKRFAEAEACYRRALSITPNIPVLLFNLGIFLNEQKRGAEAEHYYRRALAINPDYADAHTNLGNLLLERRRYDEAEVCQRRALSLKPNYAEAHCNLGNALRGQGKLPDAEACYRCALQIKPEFAEAHYNLGIVVAEQHRFNEAEQSYRRAIEYKPNYAEAHKNLGNTFKEQGQFHAAAASYRAALKCDPDYLAAQSNLIFDLNYVDGNRIETNLEEARQYGAMAHRLASTRFSTWKCSEEPKRLRVGMVSGDFRNHPVGFFLEALLEKIDTQHIELIAYSAHHEEDDLTARIRPRFSAWKPIVDDDDATAAERIRDDGVHILFDLSGHTANNRLPMFAYKPAPVQATWLGYFATTGVKEMDYLIGDSHVAPETEEAYFTERVWRLPESYLCFSVPDVKLNVNALPALAANRVTFGSFNNLTKLTDDVVSLWSRVLHSVPNSRLLLKTIKLSDSKSCEITAERFAAHGITPERLLLEGKVPRAELLAAYNRVDIALDPFPYTGGTTSVEALWMGVPIITRRGDRFLSHMGESIVRNVGLADWIAVGDDEYVAKAVAAASDLHALSDLRTGLRQKVLASPLFDAPRFARHFEAMLWGMWQQRKLAQGN